MSRSLTFIFPFRTHTGIDSGQFDAPGQVRGWSHLISPNRVRSARKEGLTFLKRRYVPTGFQQERRHAVPMGEREERVTNFSDRFWKDYQMKSLKIHYLGQKRHRLICRITHKTLISLFLQRQGSTSYEILMLQSEGFLVPLVTVSNHRSSS
jgi:hypothetical protein